MTKTAARHAIESPHLEEHWRSVEPTRRPQEPRTWEACVAWFRDAWEASLPTRMHTRGVEADSALGSPRLAGALRARTSNVTDHGWGVTGWDRHGQPRGMTDDGTLTRDPFLYYLERMLGERVKDEHGKRTDTLTVNALGADALVRWAYLGWDLGSLIHETWRRNHDDDYAPAAMRALLESTIKRLWAQCQREPERYPICPTCRQRRCRCAERSEAQINAESVAPVG